MKGIKKSIFITTVLMVVLTVVAVSTATLAWFSSNDTVSVNQTTVTAATSTDASIGIGWTLGTATGTSITFADITATPQFPIMPKTKPLAVAEEAEEYTLIATRNAQTTVAQQGRIVEEYFSGKNAIKVFRNEVVEANRSVAFEDAQIYPGITALNLYDKIYVSKEAIIGGYKVFTTEQIVENAQEWEEDSGVLALQVVAGSGAVNVVSKTVGLDTVKAWSEDFASDSPIAVDNVQAGHFIYNVEAASRVFGKVGYNDSLPASGYVANAFGAGIDYQYALTKVGELETGDTLAVHMTVQEVSDGEYASAKAADGDYIYAIESAQKAVTSYNDFTFNQAQIDGEGRFKEDTIQGASPAILNEQVTGQQYFFVRNNGTQSTSITIKADVQGPNADLLRLAVFTQAGSETTYTYKGTLSANGGKTVYGTILGGAFETAYSQYDSIAGNVGISEIANLGAGQGVRIRVIAWYDGLSLTAIEGGRQATFTLSFQGK